MNNTDKIKNEEKLNNYSELLRGFEGSI